MFDARRKLARMMRRHREDVVPIADIMAAIDATTPARRQSAQRPHQMLTQRQARSDEVMPCQ